MKILVYAPDGAAWRALATLKAGPEDCLASWAALVAKAAPDARRGFVVTGTAFADVTLFQPPAIADVAAVAEELTAG